MDDRWCGACGVPLGPGDRFCGGCGAATGAARPAAPPAAGGGPATAGGPPTAVVPPAGPPSGPPGGVASPPPPPPSGRRRGPWALALALVVVGALAGALVAVVVTRDAADPVADGPAGGSSAVEVALEGVDHVNDQAFTQSVVSPGVDLGALAGFSTLGAGAAPSSSADVVVSEVTGDAAGLYGSSAAGEVCDADALAVAIAGDEDLNRVWSGVAGVDPDRSATFISSLTPVVLGRDTAVTNHTYSEGGAFPYQAVLQAGSPVLVDDTGAPRAQCGCGNPLLAAQVDGGDVDVVGDRWDGFDPQRITRVAPAPDPVPEIETVDVDSGEPVPVVTGGGTETVELDGLLVADDAGVHVHDGAGARLATVLDQPVERVFDDGAGGLVYNLRRPEGADGGRSSPEFDVPGDAAMATVWHLPAGETEPVALVGSEDPAARWAVAEATGTLGGRRVLLYADMALEQFPGLVPSEFAEGPLVLRDLETGEDTVVEEEAYGYELLSAPVSVGADRIAYQDGFAGTSWTVRGPDLAPVPSACTEPETSAGCLFQGALLDATHLVGTSSSETGDSLVVEVDDLVTGEVRTLDVPVGGYMVDWSGDVAVDAHEGRASVSFLPEPGAEAFPTALVDIATEEAEEVSVAGSVRFLRAPLVRPADQADETPAPPTTTAPPPTMTAPPPPPSLDVADMVVPAGSCGEGSPAITLSGGEGEVGTLGEADYVYAAIEAADAITGDVDGDGVEEVLVPVFCNYGGSGHISPVLTLRPGEGGAEEAAPPIPFARGDRDPSALRLEGATLLVDGVLYLGSDPLCCPSATFTARFELIDGAWVETG